MCILIPKHLFTKSIEFQVCSCSFEDSHRVCLRSNGQSEAQGTCFYKRCFMSVSFNVGLSWKFVCKGLALWQSGWCWCLWCQILYEHWFRSGPGCLPLIQLLPVSPGKAAEDDPGSWDLVPMWQNWKRCLAPGSWFLLGLTPGCCCYLVSGGFI